MNDFEERSIEILRDESNRRSDWDDQIKQSELYSAVEREEVNLFVTLKPKFYIDGNQWCVLLGENIQEGICGFGGSLKKAIWEFSKAVDAELLEVKE